tara:strand:+ start:135 stop:311 length:177 start_codon:yes stop_codon:yes gene_type:complete
MNDYFIILASGQSKRFNSEKANSLLFIKTNLFLNILYIKQLIQNFLKELYWLLMIKNK